jgi:hemolysin activation/secretion protein
LGAFFLLLAIHCSRASLFCFCVPEQDSKRREREREREREGEPQVNPHQLDDPNAKQPTTEQAKHELPIKGFSLLRTNKKTFNAIRIKMLVTVLDSIARSPFDSSLDLQDSNRFAVSPSVV